MLARWTTAVVLIVAFAAVAAAARRSAPEVPVAARRTIAKANADWLEAMKRQDAPAIANVYGDDAIFVASDGRVATGRAAIEQLSRERFTTMGRVVDGTIADDGMTRAGELIYEWGHATLRVNKDGRASQAGGRFLTVWAADSAGSWHITRNLSLP
jgi:uncharacterized protein (TIGR02246 family)